jgi:hypothetical protein
VVIWIVAAVAIAIAALTRLLQVAVFAIAAGLRGLFVKDSIPAGPFVASLSPPSSVARSTAFQNGKGLVTYHPAYDHYDNSRVLHALEEAAALDATYLRSDIHWRDVMPRPGEVNAAALEWYATFFRGMRETFGFTPVVVLSNPAPEVLSLSLERRLEEWEQYVLSVVRSLRGSCRHFQVLNEPNNPVFRFFPVNATAAAFGKAATVIRADVADARLSVNFLVDIWPWRRQLTELLQAAPEAIDTVAIDAYPGTWAIGASTGFESLSSLPLTLRQEFKSSRNQHSVAVMETGYSTNVPFIRGQASQVAYLMRLRQVTSALKGLEFVGLYELTDANSDAKLDPEANFGLLDSRQRRKRAFAEAQRFFGELNS